MLCQIPRLPRIPGKTPFPKSSFNDYSLVTDYRNVRQDSFLILHYGLVRTADYVEGRN